MLRVFAATLILLGLSLTSESSFAQQTGCVSGNCVNGNGTKHYADGRRYVGNFDEGSFHGEGTFYYRDGSRYEGNWDYDQRSGYGRLYYADGSRYEGDWDYDVESGEGTLYHADGRRYVGDFSDGEFHGEGSLYYADGSHYVGNFGSGEFHGEGTFYYADGGRYEGDWDSGQRSGWGALYYADGSHYMGNFLDGEFWGEGTMYRSDGSVKEQGYWGGGVLEESRSLEHCASGDCLNGKGTKYYVDGSRYEGDFVNGGRNGWGMFFSARGLPMYEGQWNSMGRYHGTGTQFYEDGAVNYKGDWDNNFRHGVGTLYSQDGGISYQGGWDKNTIHGSGKLFKNGKLTYEGGFFKGEKHGYGVSINADGTRYEGDWYFGEKSGRGTFYYADGNRYEGEVDLGEATGAGVFYYADGRRFVGEVDRNTRSGKGTLYREDGSVSKQGIWLDDNFVQAMVLDDTAQPVKQQAPQVELDSQPPEITMQRGVNVVAKALHTVKGKATDTSGVAIVEVNGKEASLDADGNFSVDILLAPGTNEVIIAATDTLENTGYRKYSITREANAPIATPKATPLLSRTLTTGDYYALLIGVNEYESSTINDLVEPVKDTEKLGQVLVDNYSFEADNVSQLINPTHDEILDELDGLAERLTQDDNLLIFYAGHGYWDESREEGYWLPSDADQNRTRAWISNRTIVSAIKGIKTQHTLLISDACFSGGIFKTRSAFNDIPPATEALYDLPSRKAMSSGTLTEVPDKSVFIEYLIKRLENNDNKYSTSQEIFASMRTAVINNSPTEQVPQFGEIRNTGDEGGDFIFVRR